VPEPLALAFVSDQGMKQASSVRCSGDDEPSKRELLNQTLLDFFHDLQMHCLDIHAGIDNGMA
jgi:hypothetical protein